MSAFLDLVSLTTVVGLVSFMWSTWFGIPPWAVAVLQWSVPWKRYGWSGTETEHSANQWSLLIWWFSATWALWAVLSLLELHLEEPQGDLHVGLVNHSDRNKVSHSQAVSDNLIHTLPLTLCFEWLNCLHVSPLLGSLQCTLFRPYYTKTQISPEIFSVLFLSIQRDTKGAREYEYTRTTAHYIPDTLYIPLSPD